MVRSSTLQRVARIEPVIGRHLARVGKEDPVPDAPAGDRPLERDRRLARPRLDGGSNERRRLHRAVDRHRSVDRQQSGPVLIRIRRRVQRDVS